MSVGQLLLTMVSVGATCFVDLMSDCYMARAILDSVIRIWFVVFHNFPLSVIRKFFTVYAAMVYVIQVCWQLASCQQTCMTYTIAVCTVKNSWFSWWWTEELSETCRVLFQKKFEKLVHLFERSHPVVYWFYIYTLLIYILVNTTI